MARTCPCARWWASAGAEHDPDCPAYTQQGGHQLLLAERMLTVSDTDLAAAAYTAYFQAAGGMYVTGWPMPDWDKLSDRAQDAWIAATTAVRTAVTRGAADHVDTVARAMRQADGTYPDEWTSRECHDAVQAAAQSLRDSLNTTTEEN
jgi:ABC-type branched-subunit amino acid transport system substrate-binding protein